MSSFASPIPPPIFDSDESDVASQQSTDSSYLASQFNRRTRLIFTEINNLTINSSNSQVLPPSSTLFDESTCGSCSQSLQDDSRNHSQQSSQQDFILNDSINIESALSRLTTLSQTPSEISYQSSPISSHLTKSNEFKSPCHLRYTPSSGTVATKPTTTYTVKYATKNTKLTNNNKHKRSTTRKSEQHQLSIDRVSLKTPNQSPCTRRKNLDYVQESTFRSPKVQRRSRHHDDSINLPSLNISNHDEQLTKSKGDLVNTHLFRPQLDSSQNKLLKLDLSCVPIDTTTPVPRYRTRLVAKRDQQAAAHVPSDCRQSSRTVPLGSPSLRELTIRRFDEEFHQESLLGHGEFSHVYLCKNRLDGITYAIKSSKQPVIGTSYEQMAWREICAHAVLISHENLVRYHSAWIEPDGRFFVQLEYCNNGSLEDILEKNRRNHIFTSEQQSKDILHQISDALTFMHAQDLAHLDIKPANIMLCQRSINLNSDKDDDDDSDTDHMIYKLTDLGHVSQISLSSIEEDGDSRYLALEALQKSNSKQLNLAKCDIFSLGLTLYVCATNREMPKQGNEWQQLRLNITQYLHSISHCTNQFNELLLGRMCNVDPNQRPSAYELLLNPIASPTLPTSRESLRHSLKRERQKNLMLNKKLLSHYLLTNSSDLQTLPTGNNDTSNISIQCQPLLISPTQSTLVPQHQYASTPNDNSRVLLINTSITSGYSITTPSTNLNQSFASPARGGSLAMKQQTKLVGPIPTNINTCHNELEQVMMESVVLEHLSTLYHGTLLTATVGKNDELETIQTFYEQRDCTHADPVNLTEDYIDIEPYKQQRINETINQDDNKRTINVKFPVLVEGLEQFEEEINKPFQNQANEQTEEFKKYLIDVKQRTLTKGQELIAPKRDSERKPSQIPIAVATNTPATSASICESVLSKYSIVSTSSTQQPRPNSSSNRDLSVSGDLLSTSPHVRNDSEKKPSQIPIAVATNTPATSTSIRESVLSKHSIASTSSTQQRPSILPLPISRHTKATNGTTPLTNP